MARDDREVVEVKGVEMPFLEHIEELRQRLIKVIATILITSIIAYIFSEAVVNYFVKPVGTVYFRNPTGAFSIRIKVSLFIGLAAAIPVIIYHFWKFVVPGLYAREVKFLIPVTLFGTIFFFGGASFCFFFVIPAAIKILLSFGTDAVKSLIDVSDYFSFVFWMCVAFGAVFELPIIAYFLGKIGLITARMLRKGRRIAIVIIIIAAGIITPTPDAFNQMMLAVPLYILYEVSILVVRFTGIREHPDPTTQG
jgi:sec-independent protein translocase protein TatC